VTTVTNRQPRPHTQKVGHSLWGYDLTSLPAASTQALAIVDLVSRKWIDHLLCPEATSLQVQVLFTRALDAEGLLDGIVGRAERLADPAAVDADQPVLLAVSDNGAQMTSGSTREFMALHAIATHFGRPGVPTDQAPVESFFGHLKHEWPYLTAIADPGDLDRELAAARRRYNGVRLHAGIGYVTPDDEHAGRGAAIRQARRVGLARARQQRLAYHRNPHHHPPS
jgi:putative transposase